MKRASVPLAAAAVVLLAGCGLHNPDVVKTPPAHPRPPTPTGLLTPSSVVAAQRGALLRIAVDFTLTQATWSPDTYVAQQAHLAGLATGQALAQLAPRDGQPPAAIAAQLAAASSTSQAQVIGTDGPNAQHQVVVAYKVLATGAGRHPGQPDYQLAHVTLTRRGPAWLVTAFEIQP